MPPRLAFAGLLAALPLAVAACGDGADPVPATRTPTTRSSPTTPPTAGPTQEPYVLEGATATTSTGLQYRDDVVGSGPTPSMTQSVTVNYAGRLIDGTEFDAGDNITFALNRVIPGFAEGISTMKVGGKRTMYLPAAIAYANRPPAGSGIPVNAGLIFEVELLAVR
ncbi:MAG TPA: FKBP-type peptidyl-prolyl cis-trans isomerase [Tepidiformaceae bacterium]|nr:FKBP-type peptidyl-prolyl cis-trans isomerase [Tepidiformaceae bacterium]